VYTSCDQAAARLATAEERPGTVRVELRTAVGLATLYVPSDALTPEGVASGGAGAPLALDSFVTALVDAAMAEHDRDGNATLEADEFVAFAGKNPFLSLWFGHLTDAAAAKTSWKDAHLA
jgi:hypothetical protein